MKKKQLELSDESLKLVTKYAKFLNGKYCVRLYGNFYSADSPLDLRIKIDEVLTHEKIELCKGFYQAIPYTTKVYMAMQTKTDIGFIQKHWKKITA